MNTPPTDVTAKPPRLVLYSMPNCPHCRRLRQWLRSRGIQFREEEIGRNRRAFKEFQRLGGRTVPLLRAGDRTFGGFDPERLRKWFKQMGVPTSPKERKP